VSPAFALIKGTQETGIKKSWKI